MTKEQCKSVFTLAGISILRIWELANQYWPRAIPENWSEPNEQKRYLHYAKVREENPWWLVKTSLGLIQIGWRKRVIEIDWSDTQIKSIVTEDPVTKDETSVHAWSIEDAVKYLKNLKVIAEQRS